MATRTDARGVVTNYTYDTLNRLDEVSYSVGSTGVTAAATVDYTYGTSVSSNNKGRLVSVSNGFASDTFTYGTLGQVTAVAKVINSATYNLGYGYNDAGQLTSITYPSGRVVTQTMDAIGRLEKVTSSSVDYLTVTDFTAAGAVHTATLGNGVSATFGFNDRLQLESLSYVKNANKLLELTYSYTTSTEGNNGQIRRIEDSSSVTGASGRTVDYSYDAWARLKTAVTTGSTQFPQWGLSWTYDRYGNRKEQDVTHGTGPSNELTINTSNNRITDSGYSYDSNGNLLANGTITLTYDSANQVLTDSASAHSFSYNYDGAGLRARKRFLNFVGTQVVAEYDITTPTNGPTTTILTEYIYAGSQKLASITGGTTKYHLQDHLSTRVTTDSSGGNAVEQAQYPFGEDWFAGSGASKFKFTTYERDTAQSDYAVFRNYQYLTGRFNRPDPIGGSHISPQTLNRYTYSRNDPINLVDPVGLEGGGYSGACIWFLYANGRGEILGSCNSGGPDDLMLMILDLMDREGGGGDLKKLRKQAVKDCVKEIFNVDLVGFVESSKGKGGVFIGDGTDMIRAGGNDALIIIRNDVTRFTRAELTRLYGKGKEVDGLTLDGVFWLGFQPIPFTPYTNYAGSDQSLAAISTNQIHELAHSLAMITGVKTPPDTEGSDIGDKLVDCVLQHMLAALKRSGNK